jgi:hypothetical protein
MAGREPNTALARVLERSGMSHKSLAARVRAEAARRGLAASPDHVSVRRWLDGTRPRDETIACLAAVLSARLGRQVSAADLGYSVQPQSDTLADAARYPAGPGRAVELLADLADADDADSPQATRSAWSIDAAPGAIAGYLFADPAWQDAAPGPPGEAAGAERIRAFTRHLMELDFQFGGGHVRRVLLHYFRSEIVPQLRAGEPERVRRDLFSAAGEAAQLLGWTAYDAGRHAAAQRYFVQGLRLAQEAQDPVLAARLLSNLSHQANYRGQYSQALQLARAAQTAAAGRATATVQAMLLAMEARALASSGDARLCAEVLHRAERAFESSRSADDPAWISYFDAREMAGEAAHCFRDLGQPGQTLASGALAIDPLATPSRTRAFISIVTAAGACRAGDLDQALALAGQAVDLGGSLRSSRYVRYLADFRETIEVRYAAEPAVREFLRRLEHRYPQLRHG